MEFAFNRFSVIAATPIIVGLGFWFYRTYFPPPPEDYDSTVTLEDLRTEFRTWHSWQVFLTLLFIIVFGFLWFAPFWWVGALQRGALESRAHTYLLYSGDMGPWVWSLPALFTGAISATLFVEHLYRRILGERYAEFTRYQRLETKFDLSRYENYGILFGFVVAFVLLFALLDSYVIIDEETIVINGFLSFSERSYEHKELETIVAGPLSVARVYGDHVDDWRFILTFSDGYRWSCEWDPSDSSDEVRQEIAEFLSQRSGVSVRYVDLITRDLQ